VTGATTVTLPRVVAGEWTKLAGVRSSWGVPVGTVLVAATLAYALGLFVRPEDARPATTLVVSGWVLAQLGVLVLGVLVGTAEFSTGTAATTFTAVPRRLPVLAAQTLLTAGAALLTALVALGASALVTLAQRPATAPGTPPAGESLRVLGGYALYLTCVALLGLALGALVRRSAAALVTGVLLLVVADQVLAANPGRLTDTARSLLPGSASRLLLDDGRLAAADAADLGPHLGVAGTVAVLVGWVVVLLVAAAYRLRRHDVR